jgi:O-antigen ligase
VTGIIDKALARETAPAWMILVTLATFCVAFTPWLDRGERTALPDAQYLFGGYALVLTAWLILVRCRSSIASLPRTYLAATLVAFVVFALSAVLCPAPATALRLLAIIAVLWAAAALPVALATPATLERMLIFVAALWGSVVVITIALDIIGPITVSPHLVIENYIFANQSNGPAGSPSFFPPRWASFFPQANGFGEYLLIGIASALYCIMACRSWLPRTISLALLGCETFALWMTGSRGAVLGVAAVLFVYGVSLISIKDIGRPVVWRSAMAASLVAAVAVAILVHDRWQGAAIFLNRRPGEFLSGRFELWAHALRLWWSSPWFGYGFGRSVQLLSGPNMPAHSALNVFIGTLCETGIFGLAALLILWGGGALRAFLALRASMKAGDRKIGALATAALSLLFGLGVQQIGEWTVLRVTLTQIVFVSILTMAWRLPALVEPRHSH